MKTRTLIYKISLPLLALSFAAVTGCSKKAPLGTTGALTPTGQTPGSSPIAGQIGGAQPGSAPGSVQGGSATPPGMAPSGHLAVTPVAQVPGIQTPVAPAPTCFTLSYHHQTLAAHNNDEACSHHRNLVNIGKIKFNSASLCVRVDEKAVHFKTVKGHSDQLLIGPIAGPKSHVTVSYCTGKNKCALDCKVVQEKDDFMNAIGAGQPDEANENANNGQWDPNEKESDITAHLDTELKKELGDDGDTEGQIFAGWVSDGDAASCASRQAKL